MGAALAIGTTALSVVGAIDQNRQVRKAAEAEKATNDIAARERREITAREVASLEGTIRASAAGRGAGGRSTDAQSLSSFAAGLAQQRNINTNQALGNLSTDARASSAFTSPLFTGLSVFGSTGGADIFGGEG